MIKQRRLGGKFAAVIAVMVAMGLMVPATSATAAGGSSISFTEVDGKKVVAGKLPSIVIAPTTVWVTGQAAPGNVVTVSKKTDTTKKCQAKASGSGRWSCALPASAFGLKPDAWTTTPLVASTTAGGKTVTAALSVTAKIPVPAPPTLTITQVEGKTVANSKAPSFTTDKAVIWTTGQTTKGTVVTVTKKTDPTQTCTSTADTTGRWSCSLPVAAFDLKVDTATTTVLVATATIAGKAISAEVAVTAKTNTPTPPPPPPVPVFKVLTVNDLAVDAKGNHDTVIVENDALVTVTGAAKPGTEVHLHGWDIGWYPYATTDVVADASGNWAAQITIPGWNKIFDAGDIPLDFRASAIVDGQEVSNLVLGLYRTLTDGPPQFIMIDEVPIASILNSGPVYFFARLPRQESLSFQVNGKLGSDVTVYLTSDPTISCTATVEEDYRRSMCDIPYNKIPWSFPEPKLLTWGVMTVTEAGETITGLPADTEISYTLNPLLPIFTNMGQSVWRTDGIPLQEYFFLKDPRHSTVEFRGTALPGAEVRVVETNPAGDVQTDRCLTTTSSEGIWSCMVTLSWDSMWVTYTAWDGDRAGESAEASFD